MAKTSVRVLVAMVGLAGCASSSLGQWSADPFTNFAIGDKSGIQNQPKVVALPDGGAYVGWMDNNAGGYDMYLQRIDRCGVEQWPHNGVLVRDRGVSSTQDWDLDVDAGGNAIVAYNDDFATPGGAQQITVSKVMSDGTVAWHTSVTTGSASRSGPKVAVLSDGTMAVAYSVSNTLVIQKLDGSGTPLLAAPGITLSEATHLILMSEMQPTTDGGFVLMWLRGRTTSFNKSLYAQKFSSAVAPLWTGTGTTVNGGSPVVVYDAGTTNGLGNGYFPTFLPDNAGGAVFGWYEGGGVRDAYVQHLLADGTKVWATPQSPATLIATRMRVGAGLDYNKTTGDIYLACIEVNKSPQVDYSTLVQKWGSDGRAWGGDPDGDGILNGTIIIPQGTPNQQSFIQSVASNDGCFVFGFDSRSATTGLVFGARVAGDGSVAWSGFPSTKDETKSRLSSTLSTVGSAMIAFGGGSTSDPDINLQTNIKIQNIFPDGRLGCPCPADFDGSGGTPDIGDIDVFFSKWLGGDCQADVDCSGGTPDAGDIDTFFVAWLAGGC